MAVPGVNQTRLRKSHIYKYVRYTMCGMRRRYDHIGDRDRSSGRSTLTRRRALRTLGTITGISIAGCLDQDTAPDPDDDFEDAEDEEDESDELADESLDPPENGAVAFVYDDGPIEDDTQAFPVHEEFDASTTTGIVTDWIGRNDDWMDIEHLEELAAADWGIEEEGLMRSVERELEWVTREDEDEDLAVFRWTGPTGVGATPYN
jgi:hypothetical protein